MDPRLRKKLTSLITQGKLASSQCDTRFKTWIRPLMDTGVVRLERERNGSVLKVIEAAAIQAFHDRHFPVIEYPAEGTRIAGVMGYRSSKVLRNDTPEILMMRVSAASPLIGRPNAHSISAEHGVLAQVLSAVDRPELSGHWVLIENPAVFHRYHEVFGNDASALLTHGRISNKVIDWLALHPARSVRFTYAPDYDAIGLDEFGRLRQALADRIELHVPSNIDDLFERFSDRDLMHAGRHRTLLRKAADSRDPVVQRLVQLIHKHNAGLEQEALLIDVVEDIAPGQHVA